MNSQLNQCNDFLQQILKTKKQIYKDIFQNLEDHKCNIKIRCKQCYDTSNATFNDHDKTITICSNKVNIMYDVIEGINHELIHAFDSCINKIDWDSIDELVCSEIKASFHSECKDKGFTKQELFECVKRGAINSTNRKDIVDKLMPKCFNQDYKFKL